MVPGTVRKRDAGREESIFTVLEMHIKRRMSIPGSTISVRVASKSSNCPGSCAKIRLSVL